MLAPRGTLSGGQVSRLQVAELVAACLDAPEASQNKVWGRAVRQQARAGVAVCADTLMPALRLSCPSLPTMPCMYHRASCKVYQVTDRQQLLHVAKSVLLYVLLAPPAPPQQPSLLIGAFIGVPGISRSYLRCTSRCPTLGWPSPG